MPGVRRDVGDPLAIRRPGRIRLLGQRIRDPMGVRAVRVHHIDVARTAPSERDLLPVGRPRRVRVVLPRRSQSPRTCSISIHHEDVECPVAPARESDLRAIGRPRRLDLEEQACGRRCVGFVVGQPVLRSPVGIHLVDRVVAVPSADEGEVGPRLVPTSASCQANGTARSEQQRATHKRKATEDRRGKEARSLVCERLDAEVPALQVWIPGELRSGRFCRDLARRS